MVLILGLDPGHSIEEQLTTHACHFNAQSDEVLAVVCTQASGPVYPQIVRKLDSIIV